MVSWIVVPVGVSAEAGTLICPSRGFRTKEDGSLLLLRFNPSSMCRILAAAILSDVHATFPAAHGDLDDWTLHAWATPFFVPLDPYMQFTFSSDCMAHGVRRPNTSP